MMTVSLHTLRESDGVLMGHLLLRVERHTALAAPPRPLALQVTHMLAKGCSRPRLAGGAPLVTHDASLDGHALPIGAHRKLRCSVTAASNAAVAGRPAPAV